MLGLRLLVRDRARVRVRVIVRVRVRVRVDVRSFVLKPYEMQSETSMVESRAKVGCDSAPLSRNPKRSYWHARVHLPHIMHYIKK